MNPTTILIRIPAHTPLGSLRALADDIGCDVRLLPDGTYLFRERHGNANVTPMQRYRNQIGNVHDSDLPQPPTSGDAA